MLVLDVQGAMAMCNVTHRFWLSFIPVYVAFFVLQTRDLNLALKRMSFHVTKQKTRSMMLRRVNRYFRYLVTDYSSYSSIRTITLVRTH